MYRLGQQLTRACTTAVLFKHTEKWGQGLAKRMQYTEAASAREMTHNFFKTKEQSEIYGKYMIREPEEVRKLILSYLNEKKNSFGLAVDLGCGTGHSTQTLVPYFKKVIGVDISRTQIEEAEKIASFSNLSYLLASAEKLPFQDGTVDLVTASVAAHWFIGNTFLREADRVLKPSGCLAVYSFNPCFKLHYKGCSEILTSLYLEAFDFLNHNFSPGFNDQMISGYQQIYDAAPFADKQRITNMWLKRSISVAGLIGFFKAMYMFQNFKLADPEAATNFLNELKNSFTQTMETSSVDTELEIAVNYFCVLACKSSSEKEKFGLV